MLPRCDVVVCRSCAREEEKLERAWASRILPVLGELLQLSTAPELEVKGSFKQLLNKSSIHSRSPTGSANPYTNGSESGAPGLTARFISASAKTPAKSDPVSGTRGLGACAGLAEAWV